MLTASLGARELRWSPKAPAFGCVVAATIAAGCPSVPAQVAASNPVAKAAPAPRGVLQVLARGPESPEGFTMHDLTTEVWVVDLDRIGRVEADGVRWEPALARGMQGVGAGMEPRPFGRWPEATFSIGPDGSDNGYQVPGLYVFVPSAERWVSRGVRGGFRTALTHYAVGADRWLLMRSGFGIGGNIPVEIAIAGPGSSVSAMRELPCRSEGTEVQSSAEAEGQFYIRCQSREADAWSLLHGTTTPVLRTRALEIDDERLSGAVLTGPRRFIAVVGRELVQLDVRPPADAEGATELEALALGSLPDEIGELQAAAGPYVWFVNGPVVSRRDATGAVHAWSLPEGARFARANADGGAWIQGSIVARAVPP